MIAPLGHVRLDVLDTLTSVQRHAPPEYVAAEIGRKPGKVRKVLLGLLSAGLVSMRADSGTFRITSEGRRRHAQALAKGSIPGFPGRRA